MEGGRRRGGRDAASEGLTPPVPAGKGEEGATSQGEGAPLEGGTGTEMGSPRSLQRGAPRCRHLDLMAEALGSDSCPTAQEDTQVVVWSATEGESPATAALDSE